MTNKKTPANIRQTVWNIYIGENIGKIKCPLCQQNDIQPFQFHCAHVIARSHGGSMDVSNLRPICAVCNNSMYNHNMIEFAQTYYPNAPIHETFLNRSIIFNKKSEKPYIIPIQKSNNCTNNELAKSSTTASKKKYICQYCAKRFTRKNNMVVHQKTTCRFRDSQNLLSNQIKELKENNNNLQEQLTQLKNKQLIGNRTLQVICIGQSNSY